MSIARSFVFITVVLVAVLVSLFYQQIQIDDRLQLPTYYTHLYIPIRRILPKLLPSSKLASGDTIRSNARALTALRNWCLGNEPERELESVFKDESGREVLRYKKDPTSDLKPKTTLVFIHGGGFVLGNPEEYTGPVAEIAASTSSEVYFIRYRLAPENTFPIPVEDCVDMVKWLIDNSERFNIDKDTIQLFGDSAGGNLVTNVALALLQQADRYPLKAVHAIYPSYYTLHDLPSNYEFFTDPAGVINKPDVAMFTSLYFLGDTSCTGARMTNDHVSPKVIQQFTERVLELKLTNYPQGAKIELDTKDSASSETAKNQKCAERFEAKFLDYRSNAIFTPNKLLENLNKTNFVMYSCEIDIIRDCPFLMASILTSLDVKYEHTHIDNCYHGSFNDNTIGGKMIRGKLIKSIKAKQ